MKFHFSWKIVTVIAAILIISVAVGTYVWRNEHRSPLLEVYLFALRSGQATLIRTPEDKRILINGGSNSEIVRHISKVLPFYSRRIDIITATDTLAKNTSGLIDVLHRYNVDQLLIPAITLESLGLASTTDQTFKSLLAEAKKKQVKLDFLEAGDNINLGNKVIVTTLFPVEPEKFSYSKASGPEIVLRIEYESTVVTILGNTSRKIQKFIASSTLIGKLPQTSEVFVISHSGNAEDLSAELFETFSPEYLLYSRAVSYTAPKKNSSANKVVNPSDSIEPLKRINLREAETLRATSNGEGWDIK